MSITTDTGMTALLSAAVSRMDYCAILETNLSAPRRAVAKRNGVTFRDVALSGAFTVNGQGAITGLGAASGTTVALAADLSTGSTTLRISGNGHWIEGTLGLTGSGCDFIMSANPTTTNGFAIGAVSITPPAALPVESFGDIDIVRVMMGPAGGTQQQLVVNQQLYTGMSVGRAGVTQKSWKCAPIDLQAYVLDENLVEQIVPGQTVRVHAHPCLDSNGRVEVRFWADVQFDEPGVLNVSKGPRTADNRQYAKIDLSIFLSDVPQTLWEGTTYTFEMQRGTTFRWESESMPWYTSVADVRALITEGKIMPHATQGAFFDCPPLPLVFDNVTDYKPYKTFGTVDQVSHVGSQVRGTGAGGERTNIGMVDEYIGHFVAEVGTHGNAAFNTPGRVATMKNMAESICQFPLSGGVLSPSTGRILDPANDPDGPFIYDINNDASHNVALLPQPGINVFDGSNSGIINSPVSKFNSRYDQAHCPDLASYHAYQFTNDPWYSLHTQTHIMALLGASEQAGLRRGPDGRMFAINSNQERAWWWCLQHLEEAIVCTPGDMPAPFLNKSHLVTLRDNTLQYLKDEWIGNTSDYVHRMCDMWGAMGSSTTEWEPLTPDAYSGTFYRGIHNLGQDYGNIILTHMCRLGCNTPLFKEVVEWHARGLKFRLMSGGELYNHTYSADNVTQITGPYEGATPNMAVPYSTPAEFNAWISFLPGVVTSGNVSYDDWFIRRGGWDGGNYTFLALAAAKCYRYMSENFGINCGFDIVAEQQALEARIMPPTGTGTRPTFTSKHTFNLNYSF
ncbi:MAG: hypothetical protein ACXW2U_05435 [Telluria sp.]